MKYFYILIIINLVTVNINLQIKAQTWEKLDSINNPSPLSFMTACNGKIYLLSGTTDGLPAPTNVYDPETNQWSKKAPIPNGCVWGSAESVFGKIYVLGGRYNNVSRDFNFIYDPEKDEWTTGEKLLTPRSYLNSAVVNNKIYIIGGQNGDGTTEWYFDEYDPEANKWTRKAQTPHNQAWYCGAVSLNNKFYRIAGGRWNAPTDYFDSYNPETDKWEVLSPFPITLHAPAAVIAYRNIIVMGGYNNSLATDYMFSFNPNLGIWIQSPNKLPYPMAYHKACVIGNYIYLYHFNSDAGNTYGNLWRFQLTGSGIENNIANDISIIYLPNNNSFVLNIPNYKIGSNYDIKVYNLLGDLILTNIGTINKINEIILSNEKLSKGIYFVSMYISGVTYIRKILIE